MKKQCLVVEGLLEQDEIFSGEITIDGHCSNWWFQEIWKKAGNKACNIKLLLEVKE